MAQHSASATEQHQYTGRFAPSPTGDLHQGSLTTALASFLDARAYSGTWLVRMEDLDPPREVDGAASSILRSLEAHGLHWDQSVLYQSTRTDAYRAAFDTLLQLGLIYPCQCNRQRLKTLRIYDRCCLRSPPNTTQHCAWRLKVDDGGSPVTYDDLFLGHQSCHVANETGDFIVRRKDGLYAYQLAVVVDDIHQGVNHILRGSDLADSTPRQHWLYRLLDSAAPVMGHLPLVTHRDGQKFSKQNLAPPLKNSLAPHNLFQALQQLGLHPPAELEGDTCEILLQWGIEHWNRACVPQSFSSNLP